MRAHRPSLLGAAHGVVLGALLLTSGSLAWADAEAHAQTATGELASVDREAAAVQSTVERARGENISVEERVANGELLYRTKDYARAGLVFSEILERYPNTPSYPDALWLRGETFYASHEYLSARRDYRALVMRGSEPRFQSYFGKALARLVDVSLRVGDIAALDEVFQRLGQVPPAQVDAGLNYAKGKAYFARGDFTMSQQSFAAVPNGGTYSHQARYFQGIIAMKVARPAAGTPVKAGAAPVNYKQAIETFKLVTDMPPDSADHRHVIDLSWMAIGRLFYEMEQYNQAAEAYAKVGRESPEFDTMLYELAWVYVRIGDIQRAERALEVLSVADPSSPYVGDGTLLRADLLLRAGAFDKALQLYEGVRAQYDPMRARVESFLDETKDVSVFYDKLSQQQLDVLDQSEQLPPLAVRWAREAEDGPAAFAVIDDINQCKSLLKQSQVLIDKLLALTSAANRVRAFPELQAGEQRALALFNRVTRARLEIARGLDQEEAPQVTGEIASVRDQRRALMATVEGAPTSGAEFDAREQAGMKQWNTLSQELTRRAQEIDQLQATVNGLRRVLREDTQQGVTRDPASIARFEAELIQNERDLRLYQDQVVELRRQVDFGRAQVGIGDARYQNDAIARQQFRDLLEREAQLASAGQAGGNGQRFSNRISPLLVQARREDEKLQAVFDQLEKQVAVRTQELQAKIDVERGNIEKYTQQLEVLDNGAGGARDLVGHVAQRNFMMVRDKLRGIVLRADVGITEQAWEVREEELARVHNLQTERAREEQLLDEELREVLDDATDPGQGTPTPK